MYTINTIIKKEKMPQFEKVKIASKLLDKYYAIPSNIKVVDIGCNDMSLTEVFVEQLKKIQPRTNIDILGLDISYQNVSQAKNKNYNCQYADITATLDQNLVNNVDLVLFFDVIEHLAATDKAIKNIHKMLKPNGMMLLTTPNLAAWYNRLLLLLGFQPHCTEVSDISIRFGCRFLEKILGETEITNSAGHLRVFTYKALKEFLNYYDFEIIKSIGYSNQSWDFVSKCICSISTELAGSLCLLIRKKNIINGENK